MQIFDAIANFFVFVGERYPDILSAAGQHALIALIATLLGIVVAIPVAIMISRSEIKWLNSIVFSVANLFQTIPSLALLALMIPLFGIGMTPAVIALFLYSLLPLLRNTYAGLQSVDPALRDASKGMGYSRLPELIPDRAPFSCSIHHVRNPNYDRLYYQLDHPCRPCWSRWPWPINCVRSRRE